MAKKTQETAEYSDRPETYVYLGEVVKKRLIRHLKKMRKTGKIVSASSYARDAIIEKMDREGAAVA